MDFTVENHGSIFIVQPLTSRVNDWLHEHTEGTWFGGGLAVEHRYVADLVQGMLDEGFTTE